MAGNPRIDELRKKLDKEPGSRLFAQLAEELRKDGDLEDAIQVAREGLQKHSNYPSARMTLGRALFDTGDWAAARETCRSRLHLGERLDLAEKMDTYSVIAWTSSSSSFTRCASSRLRISLFWILMRSAAGMNPIR